MKLIIDIPDHLYKLLKDLPSDSNEGTIENVLMKAVENGTPISDNATNGDVLISLYSNLKYSIQNGRVVTTIGVASSFDLDWWNAPYQKGGK